MESWQVNSLVKDKRHWKSSSSWKLFNNLNLHRKCTKNSSIIISWSTRNGQLILTSTLCATKLSCMNWSNSPNNNRNKASMNLSNPSIPNLELERQSRNRLWMRLSYWKKRIIKLSIRSTRSLNKTNRMMINPTITPLKTHRSKKKETSKRDKTHSRQTLAYPTRLWRPFRWNRRLILKQGTWMMKSWRSKRFRRT